MVELMVVIVIVGLAATAVLLAMPESGGSLHAEAERFAARAKAARDAAIVEARPASLAAGPGGYVLARRSGGEWREVSRHGWAEGTEAGTALTRFDTTGMAEPVELVLRRGGRQVAVAIGADGSVHVRR